MSDQTTSLNRIIDQSSNEIFIFDQATLKFLYANKGAKSNLGYSMEELSNMTPLDIKPEFTAGNFWQFLNGDSDTTIHFETTHKRKNKTTYPVEVFIHKTRFDDRPAYVAFILDLTKNKQDLERLNLVLEGSELGYWDWNFQTDEYMVNDRWLEILGLRRTDIHNNASDWRSRVHPDDLERVQGVIDSCIKTNQPFTAEFRMRHQQGRWIWIQGSGAVATYDIDTHKPLRLCGTHQDISDRKAAESHTKYIERVLKTLIDITQSINSAPSEAAILEQTCETLIETGGYFLAWIAYAEHDENKTIRPVAQHGLDNGYIQSLNITWSEDPTGQGPIGIAVRSKTPIVTNDISTDTTFQPWRDMAIDHGLQSSVSLPLIVGQEVLGTINIYSSETYAFDGEALTFLKDLASTVVHGIKSQRLLIENASHLSTLEKSLIQTINAIALALEKRDPYTAGHMNRVAQLSVAIAKKMQLPTHKIDSIRLSATIHDIGKIYVPAEILNRPGKLSYHEFEIIKSHPQVGFDIIKGITFPWEIAQIILQHHERLDGSGYPNGLKGDEILLEAQIISVADVVEAMSSHRPYRPALSPEAGLNVISAESGKHYNPEIVDACIKVFRDDAFEFDSKR